MQSSFFFIHFQGWEADTGVTKGTLGVHSRRGQAEKGDILARVDCSHGGPLGAGGILSVFGMWCAGGVLSALRRLGELYHGGQEKLALVGWEQVLLRRVQ